ncbi:hypothetical protein KRR40_37145 [Niabella defluvii]|nr:hypothetical protein KRR40_37145 [Niabella sp. I65]
MAQFKLPAFDRVGGFFNPQFLNVYSESGFFGPASYINWLLVLGIALLGALVWTWLDKKDLLIMIFITW